MSSNTVLSREDYIRYSLELNLFFLRIAKEHAIFIAASLPPRDIPLSCQSVALKNYFEGLLAKTVMLSNGFLSPEILSSGEIVTELTLKAEKATQFLTGIPIATNITKRELALKPDTRQQAAPMLYEQVSMLNHEALTGIKAAIAFKDKLLQDVLSCKAFGYSYPTMLHHVIDESQFYAALLTRLQSREGFASFREPIEEEIFWNDIMGEHAKFIRGYLDPSEEQLFEMADAFSDKFDELLSKTLLLREQPSLLPEVTNESLDSVSKLRDFKKEGTAGIIACRIKSVIPPLLGDHVTREANHYLRLLETFKALS